MFLFIIIYIVLFDIITVLGIKKSFPQFSSLHQRGIRVAFLIQIFLSLSIVFIGDFMEHRIRNYNLITLYSYVFGLIVAVYIPKGIYVLFLFIDWGISAITRMYRLHFDVFPRESRRIVAKCGFWISIIFVFLMIWGILFGRYNYTVDNVEITINELPPAFNGYKIVQISDIHAGSSAWFTNHYKKAVGLINEQEPNLIVFTGDMVNNFAEELNSVIPYFSQLNARDGKYAVLGNHDYGGYFDWSSPVDSVNNHSAVKRAIEKMGFILLNNQSVIISRYNYDRMGLIGIENYGLKEHHPKRGDLVEAMKSVRNIPFKILLSHDPAFWPEKVVDKTDIALTLSGHTHGMQMGVKFGKKRFGFAPMLGTHYWAGLYHVGKQYLYVNSGLGVIGFPGRIGMPPEITLITLRKGE